MRGKSGERTQRRAGRGPRGSAGGVLAKKARILVVDDDKGERELFARILQKGGYEVKTASSGSHGLRELKKKPFNLVLSDIVMPQLDGIELLEKIKRAYPKTPVMMITGHASIETAIEALRKGAYDYIRKPLPHHEELLHRVRHALERQQVGMEKKRLMVDLRKAYAELEVHKKRLETKVVVSDKKVEEREKDLRTAYKKLEDAYKRLEAQVDEMKRMDRLAALGEFSASIVHELRNPLTSIEGFIQLLERKYDSPGFREKFFETTTRETERINRFVDRLLTFGRPPELVFAPRDVNRVVTSTVESHQKQLADSKVTVTLQLNQALPKIPADADALEQILVNLMTNAIQAMPHGGSLTLSTDQKDALVEIRVTDTGCGIAKVDLPKIFEPFFTAKSRGTGLGLAISRGIIEKHHGRIKVESTVHRGTTFIITLPVQQKVAKRR